MPPHSLVINPSGVAHFIDGQADTSDRARYRHPRHPGPEPGPGEEEGDGDGEHASWNGRPAPKKPNGQSAGSHGQMADDASPFAAFRPREAGTL